MKNNVFDRVVPLPQEVCAAKGVFVFTPRTFMRCSPAALNVEKVVVSDLTEETGLRVNKTGLALTMNGLQIVFFNNPKFDFTVVKLPKEVVHNEGYTLYCDSNCVVLTAKTDAGLFYAGQTLVQLIRNKTVPAGSIRDWPVTIMRGYSDDISRWQVSTIENFKKIIRSLSRYKLNTYMIYIEDLFKLKKHPLVGKGRGALSASDIRGLVNYGKERFVELIPMFQTLGHFEHLIRIPKYRKLAEVEPPKDEPRPLLTPIGQYTTLSPVVPETYKFLSDYAAEYIRNFDSQYLHIGGDEPYDLGKGKSKKVADKIGVENLYRQHMEKAVKMLGKYNKKIIMYDDIVRKHWAQHGFDMKHKPRFRKDIIMMYWKYNPQEEYPDIKKLSDAGYKLVVSPSLHNYFRFYPAYYKAKANVRNVFKSAYGVKGVIGGMVSSWGDNGADNFRENNYYGYAYSSECLWNNPYKVDDKKFSVRWVEEYFGYDGGIAGIIDTLAGIDEEIFAARRGYFDDIVIKELDKKMYDKYTRLGFACGKCLKTYAVTEKKVKKNKVNLQYLKFALEFCGNSVNKNLLIDKIARGVVIPKKSVEAYIRDTKRIRAEFARLWLLTNKKEGLWVTLWRFDKLIRQMKGISGIR
ncbi:MAG: beta-N-acetylhexosaminidase [Elusimicrobiota bacterium]